VRRASSCIALGFALIAGVLPAAAQAQPYVYVTNQAEGGTVSQFDAIGGPLLPLTPATVPAGAYPTGLAVSPDGKSVYVANQFSDTVSQYDVGAGGTLSPKTPATVAGGQHPVSVAISPDGKQVYVADFIGINPNPPGTVSQYSVGAGGTLTPLTPATVAAGVETSDVAASSDGKSVYATNESDALYQYDVGPTGALTPKTSPTVADASGGFKLVVSPDGRHVYVSVLNLGVVTLRVGAGGALTAVSTTFVQHSEGIAISPDGKSLYVTQPLTPSGSVAQFDIDPAGALSPKTPAAVDSGGAVPTGIAVAPDGKSVYVTNSSSHTVSHYDVDTGGHLTPKSLTTVQAVGNPVQIAVTPPPRVPTSREQCKNGGWKLFPGFRNQGDCVSFVATKGKNPPAG
jgi:YVTN family beta-propeller protein